MKVISSLIFRRNNILYFNTYCYLFDFVKVGVGMSMEGIEQNPIVYDLMSEMAFQHKKVDVKVKVRESLVPRDCIYFTHGFPMFSC